MRESKTATKERGTQSVGISAGVLERLRRYARSGQVRTVVTDIVSTAVAEYLDRAESEHGAGK